LNPDQSVILLWLYNLIPFVIETITTEICASLPLVHALTGY
jgi:hypothetical protein